MSEGRAASLVLGSMLLVGGHACARSEVGMTLAVPEELRERIAWFELGVFPERCPEPAILQGGVPVAGVVSRQAFRTEQSPPALPSLPSGTYGIAAVARAADCGIIAIGCAIAEVPKTENVQVSIAAAENGSAACADGATCENARCVTAGPLGVDAGGSCSLTILGGGPLTPPISSAEYVGAPAVAATDTGFLIAIREHQADSAQATMTFLPVDLYGGAGTPIALSLSERCSTTQEIDGAALAFQGGWGVAAAARTQCQGTTGGVDLLQIDRDGVLQASAFVDAPNVSVKLSPNHALAATPTSGKYLLGFTVDEESRVVELTSTVSRDKPTVAVGKYVTVGTAKSSGTWLSTSADAASVVAGTSGNLSLYRGATISSLTAPVALGGSVAGIASLGTRTFVTVDGASKDATLRGFELGSTSPLWVDSFAVEPALGGSVMAADVAVSGDRIFFVTARAQAIGLRAFGGATESRPTFQSEVSLSNEPRGPVLKGTHGFRDGRVSIAAKGSRVIVAWVNTVRLQPDDNLGGYAVLGCSP